MAWGGLSEVGPITSSSSLKEINVSHLPHPNALLSRSCWVCVKRQPTGGHGVVYTCIVAVCALMCACGRSALM